MDDPPKAEPDALAQRAFQSSKPNADDMEALSAMQSLQRRLFGIKPTMPRVGRYEVIGRIGQGAMGVVYEARDPKLDRRLAIKVIKEQVSHTKDQQNIHERVSQEAMTLAKLSHPNIVEIFDVGKHDGDSYIAMEYVAGQDLDRWMSAERRNWREIVDVFVQAARGLAAAHEVGLVHRDVKPSNILIGDDGRVRVADFGLAAASNRHDDPPSIGTGANPAEALSTVQSRPAPILGTLGYMAPEQLLGGVVDTRVDIYGLCVALWEALYGTRPFLGRTVAQFATTLARQPRPKVTRGAGVPRWLHRVCRRGLSYYRHQRWATASELADALHSGPRRARRQWLIVATIGAALTSSVVWWLS